MVPVVRPLLLLVVVAVVVAAAGGVVGVVVVAATVVAMLLVVVALVATPVGRARGFSPVQLLLRMLAIRRRHGRVPTLVHARRWRWRSR